MKAKEFKQLLVSLNACEEAVKWADGKDWAEVYSSCHRGDWLLWLFAKVQRDNKRLRVLAAAHCANTVIHLMKDKRSKKAVDVAIRYGNNQATKDELNATAYAAAAAYSAAAAADAARKENQKQTADIVRKYIPIEEFNIN